MKKVGGWLIFALVLIFVGSFLAQMFNTSFYTVKVKRIKFDTNNGILSGLLYLPKGADSSDPRPTIITTHGYLNSAEMQDAAAIEMSRRGYVVLALDMYDHGHSVNKTQYDSAKAFFSFWPSSQYDAVQYMYNQDYVMKDENGNGIIAVAGHSMGGFSSTMAMVMDEQDYAKTGIRKIHAGLPMGADYSWTSYLGVTPDVAYAAYGPRTVGVVAAHYDEFFFDSAAEKTGNTVVFKDFISTPEGKAFLGNPSDPSEGVIYTLDNGGRRVIYEPWQTHPWNHFSFITTGHQISFYTKAFEGYTSPNQVNAGLGSENQIWILKEYSEFLALIGFFLLFIPLVMLLMKVPFFAKAKTERAPYVPEPATKNNKIVFWIFYAFSAAFPALFFPSLMNKDGAGITIIQVLSLVILGLGLLFGALLLSRARKEKGRSVKNVRNGMIFISLSSLLLFLTTTFRKNLFVQNKYFNQPTTNQIAFWALIVSEMILILMFVSYYLNKKQSNLTPKQYGFVTKWSSVLSSLLIAIVVVAIGYAILYFVDAIFVTDFRIWTWAVKTFESQNLLAAIKYAPFFFIFYYITGISINANTGSMKKGEGYYLSCISMVGGLVVFLALQYGLLFFTQRALVPNQALNPILLFALIPSLIVATFYTKKLYEETGNVYTGAFLNTILMTLILAANTTTYSGII